MNITSNNGKQTLKLNKKEWELIGKTAGWTGKDYIVDLAKAIKVLQQAFKDAPELLSYVNPKVIDEMRFVIQKSLAKLDKRPTFPLGSPEGIEDQVLQRNWAKSPQDILPS